MEYIGQTKYEYKRKNFHQHHNGECPRFHNAIKKYGYDNFEYSVLHADIDNQDELNRLECLEIDQRRTLSPFGYNLTSGGYHGLYSEESRMKMRMSSTGKVVSESTREKLRIAHTGIFPNEEVRKRISLGKKGKKQSKEIVDARARLISKPVICIEFGIIFPSARDAERRTGLSSSRIGSVCLGKRKTTGKLHWKFYKED